MSVAEAAQAWRAADVCTIPVRTGGNKRPAIQWAEFQTRLPIETELTEWFGNGVRHGLALLMGKVSGGMEMTELEGRIAHRIDDIRQACVDARIGEVWDRLFDGYTEISPGQGWHFIYRVIGGDVPGNKKIATRPATTEELEINPDEKVKVLVETRGEGGYVVVAPTDGSCHSSGLPWVKSSASVYGVVATLTMDERNQLHAVLRELLHEEPYDGDQSPALASPIAAFSVERRAGDELRPGDDFERTPWDDPLLLGGAGWQPHSMRGREMLWTRPGKDVRDGHSASTGYDSGRDRLFVWSSSTLFPTEEPITKFRVFSLLHHNGDNSAAASHLRALNYGGERLVIDIPGYQFDEVIQPCSFTDHGNATRLVQSFGPVLRWVTDEQQFYHFTGKRWEAQPVEFVEQLLFAIASGLAQSEDQETRKWGKRSLGIGAVRAARDAFKSIHNCPSSEFDRDRNLLNLQNGTYNLVTGEFHPQHRASDMITRMFCANYNPDAKADLFDSFLAMAVPSAELRAYVQRAVGGSLLPEEGRRAIFLLHGPSGTGKTQFLELIQHLFCDYGTTAPATTFRVKRDSSASSDLHKLRGKRFVATSETSDAAAFDEELLKRLTGGDTVSSRELYQKHVDWVPECSIWIATNFPPRFTSDDNAVWRRAKLIPFLTVIGAGDAPPPIPGYARRHLVPEADGILNWLLAGLREYQKNGLQEPESVGLAANTMRAENDSVAQFIEEQVNDGLLELGDPHDPLFDILAKDLYIGYQMWATANGERPLVRRRFTNRLTLLSQPLLSQKVGNQMRVIGVRRPPGASILGSFHQRILNE